MGDRLILTVFLPAPVDDVAALLKVIAERWPSARIDFNAPDGWHIDVGERKS